MQKGLYCNIVKTILVRRCCPEEPEIVLFPIGFRRDISPFRVYYRGPKNDRYKSQAATQFSEPEAS